MPCMMQSGTTKFERDSLKFLSFFSPINQNGTCPCTLNNWCWTRRLLWWLAGWLAIWSRPPLHKNNALIVKWSSVLLHINICCGPECLALLQCCVAAEKMNLRAGRLLCVLSVWPALSPRAAFCTFRQGYASTADKKVKFCPLLMLHGCPSLSANYWLHLLFTFLFLFLQLFDVFITFVRLKIIRNLIVWMRREIFLLPRRGAFLLKPGPRDAPPFKPLNLVKVIVWSF